MKELLNSIGITKVGHFDKDKSYVIEFENDAEYDKVFSKLDKSDLVEEDADASSVTLKTSIISYIANDYTLMLVSDFDANKYELRIKEMKGQKIDG